MAEQQFYTLITNVGQAKLANATALGTKVNFAKLQVGDGKDYNPSEAQENLKHKVWEGNINSITTDSKNKNWIVIQTIIPASVGGFNINEVGIFDNEGNMLIVSKYPSTYKPKLENGSGKDLTIKLVIQVSNTESVTLKIDPSITIATKEDIENINKTIKENQNKANTQYEEMTQEMTNLNSKNIQIDKNIENLQNNIPSNYVKSINGKIGDVKINLENLRSSCTTYYVDEENGSNYNNHGMSKSQAFKTLLHAVEVANMYNNGIYTSPVTIEILSNLTKKGQNTTLLSIANFTGIIDLKNHQTEFGLNIRYCNVKISNLIIENGYFFVNDSICHLNNCVFNHCADDTTGLSFQFCQVVLDSIRIEGENNTKISTISFLHSFASIRGAKISNAKYGIECLASIVVTSNDLVFTNCQSQYVTSQGGKIFHE